MAKISKHKIMFNIPPQKLTNIINNNVCIAYIRRKISNEKFATESNHWAVELTRWWTRYAINHNKKINAVKN